MVITLTACSQSPAPLKGKERLLGSWKAQTPIGRVLIWEFKQSSLQMVLGDQVQKVAYRVDDSRSPIELDIMTEKNTIKVILEFVDSDHFRVVGPQDYKSPRPVSFEDAKDVLEFRKLK